MTTLLYIEIEVEIKDINTSRKKHYIIITVLIFSLLHGSSERETSDLREEDKKVQKTEYRYSQN